MKCPHCEYVDDEHRFFILLDRMVNYRSFIANYRSSVDKEQETWTEYEEDSVRELRGCPKCNGLFMA